jgi:hypothetical protein
LVKILKEEEEGIYPHEVFHFTWRNIFFFKGEDLGNILACLVDSGSPFSHKQLSV